jgi:hypothetical protein
LDLGTIRCEICRDPFLVRPEQFRESRYFWERNYGSKSFRVLLSRLPNLVEVKKDRSSSDMLVTVVAPRPDRKTTTPKRRQQS